MNRDDEPRPADKTPPTTGEWFRALVVVAISAAAIVALGIWFVFSFVLQSCGTMPACG